MGRVKTLLIRLGLAGLGILLSLLLLEGLLRVVPAEMIDAIIQRSTLLQLYRLDPRVGWTLRPNAQSVHVTRNDMPIQIKTNSLGLRDNEHGYQKPDDVYRVLVLGDSFAEAKDVKLEESFPYLVEQCLNRQLDDPIEVINAGVSGYGTGEEYLFYTYEGIKYNPNLVLLVVYIGNDFTDLDRTEGQRLVTDFGGYRFSLKDGKLVKQWVSWEAPYAEDTSAIELFLRRHSLLYHILAHPESKIYWNLSQTVEEIDDWVDPDEPGQRPPIPWNFYMHVQNFAENPMTPPKLKDRWRLFQALLTQLRGRVEANNAQLAVVVIPTEYQVHPEALEQTIKKYTAYYDFSAVDDKIWQFGEPNKTMDSYFTQQSLPALDLLPYFQAHEQAGGALLYFDGEFPQHLNRGGQQLMGNLMCDWLIRNESIKLPRN